jgi:arabinofuranan 3-O-arabinosyltransferase
MATRTMSIAAAKLLLLRLNPLPGFLFGRYRLSHRETLLSRAVIVAFALINVTFMARAIWSAAWIQDASGQVVPVDFVSFWSTSLMLQTAPAHEVYDWSLHRAAEAGVTGPGYDGRFPWLNPPNFLLFVAPLALLPYGLAFLAWIGTTFIAYVAALRSILPRVPSRWIGIVACAFPASLSTTIVGQNGFLTGALVAGTLGLLDRRPIVAGCLLGLLTFKPQFGVLFPIALIASGRWQAVAAATAMTVLLLLGTTALYGVDTWLAFWNSLRTTQEAILVQGQMGFHKLQSVYGLVFWLTGNGAAAWTVQGALSAAVAALVWRAWRSPLPYDLKAAALGVGILMMTPYAFIYDFVILSVPIAFLIRAGLARGFGVMDIPLITLACLTILAFPLINGPVGPLAEFMVAVAVFQRTVTEEPAR